MPLQLTVSDEIARCAEELARASGSSPEAVLPDVLEAYFPPLPEPLKSEFLAWELASDEDMGRFQGHHVTIES